MNNQLVRTQSYLDPKKLEIIDDLAKTIKISRSQILRDALDAIAIRYTKTKDVVKPETTRENALIEMGGIGVSKTGKVGLNIDEIYLND
jgi:hypothetical protein